MSRSFSERSSEQPARCGLPFRERGRLFRRPAALSVRERPVVLTTFCRPDGHPTIVGVLLLRAFCCPCGVAFCHRRFFVIPSLPRDPSFAENFSRLSFWTSRGKESLVWVTSRAVIAHKSPHRLSQTVRIFVCANLNLITNRSMWSWQHEP